MKKRSERIKEEHEMQRAKRHKKLASFAVKGATLLSFSVVAGALLDYQASVKADEVTQGIRRYHTNNFVNALVPSAQRVARSNDLYTSVMIAQAALESGWGNSTLAKAPNYNLFGVKGSYNGQSVSMKTLEDAGGQNYYQITANFRKYPNYEASLNDYAKILTGDREGDWRSNYYRGARRSNTKTYKDATAWLTGRYATDSAYGSKLNSIIESFNLTAFDGESVAESLPQANSSVGTANNSARTEAKPAGQSTASKPSVTQTNANASSRTIQVKAGDGFYALAHRAGVSMDALLKANGLTIGSMIHPGQQLKLPGDAPVTQSQSASQAAKPQTPTSEVSGQTSVNRQQTPASKSEASGRTIQVKAGDGFYALAHRAGVSMDALLKANGLTIGSMIHPGQQLKLPGDAPVTQSQSASQAAKPQTPTSEVSGQTSVNRQQTPASKSEASGRTIQVKAGDGFYVLARRAGVSMDALLKANGLTIGSMIHPGQQLKLPGDAPVSQANSNTEVAKPQAGVSTPNGSNQQTASVRPSATNNANQSAGTIQVKAGDGFYVLARRAGVSMDALLKANGLTIGSMIHPGQQLKLPANAPVASTPAPSQAVQPNVQAATKAQGQVNATQVNAQSSTSQAVASQTTSSSVTVQPGQGLWRIAHNNGMTLEELKQLNGLTSNLIFPGQSLRVK